MQVEGVGCPWVRSVSPENRGLCGELRIALVRSPISSQQPLLALAHGSGAVWQGGTYTLKNSFLEMHCPSPATQRLRAQSANARCDGCQEKEEELAFGRYVATFHFGRSTPVEAVDVERTALRSVSRGSHPTRLEEASFGQGTNGPDGVAAGSCHSPRSPPGTASTGTPASSPRSSASHAQAVAFGSVASGHRAFLLAGAAAVTATGRPRARKASAPKAGGWRPKASPEATAAGSLAAPAIFASSEPAATSSLPRASRASSGAAWRPSLRHLCSVECGA